MSRPFPFTDLKVELSAEGCPTVSYNFNPSSPAELLYYYAMLGENVTNKEEVEAYLHEHFLCPHPLHEESAL